LGYDDSDVEDVGKKMGMIGIVQDGSRSRKGRMGRVREETAAGETDL